MQLQEERVEKNKQKTDKEKTRKLEQNQASLNTTHFWGNYINFMQMLRVNVS